MEPHVWPSKNCLIPSAFLIFGLLKSYSNELSLAKQILPGVHSLGSGDLA